MPRLFTGIEIPQDIRARLAWLGAPLPGVRWVAQEDMHITLRFAGDIDARSADEWAARLAEIDAEPFDLRLAELGAFGGRQPRIIFAGVDGGAALGRLQIAHERAARAAGLEPLGQRYKPHVTLARLRGTKPGYVARYLGSRGGFASFPFTVSRVVLFSARPGRGGGPYALEDVYQLGRSSWQAGDSP